MVVVGITSSIISSYKFYRDYPYYRPSRGYLIIKILLTSQEVATQPIIFISRKRRRMPRPTSNQAACSKATRFDHTPHRPCRRPFNPQQTWTNNRHGHIPHCHRHRGSPLTVRVVWIAVLLRLHSLDSALEPPPALSDNYSSWANVEN